MIFGMEKINLNMYVKEEKQINCIVTTLMIWVVIVRMTCALSFACIIILCKSALYITYRALGVI